MNNNFTGRGLRHEPIGVYYFQQTSVIRLSIIKGINKHKPHWYRVQIGTNIKSTRMNENEIFYLISRIQELTPDNSIYLDHSIKIFNTQKKYKLFPASKTDYMNGFQIYYDKGIIKRELIIRNAWEIGENDFEVVAINKDDEPIIPSDITDAPVLKVLEKKKLSK